MSEGYHDVSNNPRNSQAISSRRSMNSFCREERSNISVATPPGKHWQCFVAFTFVFSSFIIVVALNDTKQSFILQQETGQMLIIDSYRRLSLVRRNLCTSAPINKISLCSYLSKAFHFPALLTSTVAKYNVKVPDKLLSVSNDGDSSPHISNTRFLAVQ